MLACCCPFRASVSQQERSRVLGYCSTILILYLPLVYAMLAGHYADCAPVSFRLGRPLQGSTVPIAEC
jgi:hypothetical protein